MKDYVGKKILLPIFNNHTTNILSIIRDVIGVIFNVILSLVIFFLFLVSELNIETSDGDDDNEGKIDIGNWGELGSSFSNLDFRWEGIRDKN